GRRGHCARARRRGHAADGAARPSGRGCDRGATRVRRGALRDRPARRGAPSDRRCRGAPARGRREDRRSGVAAELPRSRAGERGDARARRLLAWLVALPRTWGGPPHAMRRAMLTKYGVLAAALVATGCATEPTDDDGSY